MSKSTKLPKPLPEEPDEFLTTTAGRQREATIRAGVLKILGRPVGLFRVAVMPLWDDNYRVNVVIGEEGAFGQNPPQLFRDGQRPGEYPPIHASHPETVLDRLRSLDPSPSPAVSVPDAEGNPPFCQVVGGDIDLHPVARDDLDVVLPHLPTDVGDHLTADIQLDHEHGIGKGGLDPALDLDCFFLGLLHAWEHLD